MDSVASTLFVDSDGPLFVGLICSCALYGWYISQVCTYYRKCHQDRFGVKLGVAVLTGLEMANLIASVHGFYHILIVAFGKPSPSIPLSFYVYYVITPITVVMVQFFFIYRLYLLLDRRKLDRLLFILTAVLGIAACVLSVESAVASIPKSTAKEVAFDINHTKFIGVLTSGLCVICDALITWSLCRGFGAERDGFATTERTIQGITTFVLNRGLVLLAVQLASFIAYLVRSPVNAFLFFPGVLSKLYANSLVSFLVAFEPQSLGFRAPSPDTFGVSPRAVEGAHLNIHLGVLQTTDVDVEYDRQIRDGIVPKVKVPTPA